MNKMTNIIEALKLIGFQPDYPNNHLSLYLDNPETKKEGKYAVIRISDSAFDSIPNAESKGLVVSVNIENEEGNILEYFFKTIC